MAIVHLSKDNFKEEVLESKVPVLVDFWATWCGPCQTMGPLVEEIAEERADIKVCKLDVDQEPELARQYRVMSIPTFLVFKEGEVVKRDMGVMSKEEVEGLIGYSIKRFHRMVKPLCVYKSIKVRVRP